MMAEVTRIACGACGYELWSSWTHELDACSRCGADVLETSTRHVPETAPAPRRQGAPVASDA
jgi:ribosomal protein S27AE